MKSKLIKCLIYILLFLLASNSYSFADKKKTIKPPFPKGPLHVNNNYPPHLMFLQPAIISPIIKPKGNLKASLAIDYSSVYVNSIADNWQALIDMELTVLDLYLDYSITNYLSVSANIPFVSMNGGFLDGFLKDYHDFFGVPNYGRENRPNDEFGYSIKYNGQDWFEAKSGGLHITDSTIAAKLALVDKDITKYFDLSFLYKLKIPTGNYKHGFSSGRFDNGLYLLSQVNLDPVTIYLTPGYTFLANPKTIGPQIVVDDIFSLFFGIEYMIFDSFSALVQLNFYTSPFDDTNIKQLDENTADFSIGFIYQIYKEMAIEFAFNEDLTYAAPDFNVHLRCSYDFNLF